MLQVTPSSDDRRAPTVVTMPQWGRRVVVAVTVLALSAGASAVLTPAGSTPVHAPACTSCAPPHR